MKTLVLQHCSATIPKKYCSEQYEVRQLREGAYKNALAQKADQNLIKRAHQEGFTEAVVVGWDAMEGTVRHFAQNISCQDDDSNEVHLGCIAVELVETTPEMTAFFSQMEASSLLRQALEALE